MTLTYDHPTSPQPLADAQRQEQLATPPHDPRQEMADALFGPKPAPTVPINVPEPVARLRESDDAGKLFAATDFHGDLGIEIEAPDAESWQAATAGTKLEGVAFSDAAAAMKAETSRIFSDLGLAAGEAREVVGLAREIAATPPDEATEQQWQAEASKRLREMHGQEADNVLALARQLVARDPRVAALLDSTRLGNHPRVVELMVQRAIAERARGRL